LVWEQVWFLVLAYRIWAYVPFCLALCAYF